MVWSIGIDTGGTFTDIMALDQSTLELWTHKIPSTPGDPSVAVLNGIDAFLEQKPDVAPSDVAFFAHGTTVATNALLELKGAHSGLLTTKNTGAVFYARTSYHPPQGGMLNPNFLKPPVLVPPSRTVEIDERVCFDGSVAMALDNDEVLRAVTQLVDRFQIESVAVCYLFSFMNPAHEQATRDIILGKFPNMRVSLSSEVAPLIREFQRFSTTVLDAYLGPLVEKYFNRVGAGLTKRGIASTAGYIMQSHGGLMSLATSGKNPVHTLLSGPAGGVIAAGYFSQITGYEDIVSFDVGGTSTDIAILRGGKAGEDTSGIVAGYHAAVPMSEISTIGAGGGTIARVGVDGRLIVGPQSAGANPGPACYKKGGAQATVTDANVVLGYLGPKSFLGGTFEVDVDLAHSVIEANVANPLGMSVKAAAFGIVRIATSAMESELRLRLLEQGLDPRRFSVVAFGGAGPLHAATLARSLGLANVIVPLYPGIGSTMGLLRTDIKHQFYQSRPMQFADVDESKVNAALEELRSRGVAEAIAENQTPGDVVFDFMVDIRYSGQGYELTVPFPPPPVASSSLAEVAQAFHALHLQKFGNSAPDNPIEIVSFRVISRITLPKLTLGEIGSDPGDIWTRAGKGTRKALFDPEGPYVETEVYDRIRMRAGDKIEGPTIIEQTDSTAIVLPGQVVRMDAFGNLVISGKE